mmetsp:Transcript_14230/g.56721  ORF Transcript_14230/g.56721 Transcript_14230/m.56721 type:complete len:236 (+) Transcript_14230:1274-1981(+)
MCSSWWFASSSGTGEGLTPRDAPPRHHMARHSPLLPAVCPMSAAASAAAQNGASSSDALRRSVCWPPQRRQPSTHPGPAWSMVAGALGETSSSTSRGALRSCGGVTMIIVVIAVINTDFFFIIFFFILLGLASSFHGLASASFICVLVSCFTGAVHVSSLLASASLVCCFTGAGHVSSLLLAPARSYILPSSHTRAPLPLEQTEQISDLSSLRSPLHGGVVLLVRCCGKMQPYLT